MGKKKYWYGYLQAGEKSSPILRDPELDTGNKDTLYLFNLKQEKILEYKCDIVEPKLRELTDDEEDLIKKLGASYKKAKKDFCPRVVSKLKAVETIKPPVAELAMAGGGDDDEDYDDI